jgi:hypothetical protein
MIVFDKLHHFISLHLVKVIISEQAAVSITVNTLDGSTARDYFTRAGGRALVNAVRTGRGSIGAFGRG